MSILSARAHGDSRSAAHTLRLRIASRALAAALVGALLCLAAPAAHADVIGVGDIAPFQDDPDNPGEDIPDLDDVQFGGEITTNGGILVVGGTDEYVGGTPVGTVVIDIPADTDPLVTERGIIGGNESTNPQDGIDGQGQVSVVSLNSAWRLKSTNSSFQDAGLVVGKTGQGFLEILAGARVIPGTVTEEFRGNANELLMVIGDFETSQGFVVVDGFATLLKHDELIVGRRGYGSMTLTDRARVESRGDVVVGDESVGSASGNGLVQVDGLGTRWNIGEQGDQPNPADLILGDQGRATVEVRNQAWIRVTDATVLGRVAGGYGELTVTGQGSKFWTFGAMTLGDVDSAAGILSINNKALVEVNGATTVGLNSFVNMGGGTLLATGAVTNNGVIRGDGRIETAAGVTLTNNGDIRNAAATANLRERLLFTGPIINSENIESIGGEIEFQGLVTNNDEIYARDAILRFMGGLATGPASSVFLDNTVVETQEDIPITSTGVIAVGASDSSAIIGSLDLAGTSFLEMTIGDMSSKLDVSGSATLAGFLNVTADPNTNFQTGDTFELIEAAGGLTGMPVLTTMNIGGFTASLSTTATSLFLTLGGAANPATQGDFDGDGDVDGDDLAILLGNFGAPPPPVTPADGDADGDGDVDGEDLLIWQQNQGGGGPAVPATGAVPEPATVVLFGLGLAGLGMRRRRR